NGRQFVQIPCRTDRARRVAPRRAFGRGVGRSRMNVIRPGRAADEAQASATQVEGELGELIRRDVAQLRRPQLVEPNGDAAVTQVNTLIDRVSGASVREIEKL